MEDEEKEVEEEKEKGVNGDGDREINDDVNVYNRRKMLNVDSLCFHEGGFGNVEWGAEGISINDVYEIKDLIYYSLILPLLFLYVYGGTCKK